MVAFEEQFIKGELKPTLKSEEPSEEDTAEPVKVLKGKSFAGMVLENGDDLSCRFAAFCSVCVWGGGGGGQSVGIAK